MPNHWNRIRTQPHVELKTVAPTLDGMIESGERVLRDFAATAPVPQQQHSTFAQIP